MPSAQRSRSKQQEQQQQQLSDDDLAPGAPVETLSASQLDNLSIEPVENQDQLPCSVSGFFPALSGGAIGFVFGAGGAAFGRLMNRKAAAAAKASGTHVGFFKHTWQEGAKSAKAFSIMSGVYSTASCVAKRLRQRDDAINGAVAGCATGLALGWNGGPASAAQSCAMIGIFSYIVDRLGAAEAQASQLWLQQQQQQQHGASKQPGARQQRRDMGQGCDMGHGQGVMGVAGRTGGQFRGLEGPDDGQAGSHRRSARVRGSRGSGSSSSASSAPAAAMGSARGAADWSGQDWADQEDGARDVAALLQQSAAAFLTPAARWLRPCDAQEGTCWLGPRRPRR